MSHNTNFQKFSGVHDGREYEIATWVDSRTSETVSDTYVKIDGHIANGVCRWNDGEFSISEAIDITLESITYRMLDGTTQRYYMRSLRPYQLGQACDGSIAAPVLALFADACDTLDLSRDAIHGDAYPDKANGQPDWEETKRFADWQGVAYPNEWNEDAIAGLYSSLTAVNYASLRDSLAKACELADINQSVRSS